MVFFFFFKPSLFSTQRAQSLLDAFSHTFYWIITLPMCYSVYLFKKMDCSELSQLQNCLCLLQWENHGILWSSDFSKYMRSEWCECLGVFCWQMSANENKAEGGNGFFTVCGERERGWWVSIGSLWGECYRMMESWGLGRTFKSPCPAPLQWAGTCTAPSGWSSLSIQCVPGQHCATGC